MIIVSKTYGFSLNENEVIEICTKLNIRESNIGNVIKATLLDKKHSNFFSQKLKFIAEESKIQTVEEKVKDMSLEQLVKHLGVKGNNVTRKLDSKGLYFQKNLEDYLMKFLAEWRNDINKIPELIYRVDSIMFDEYVAREFLLKNGVKSRQC